MPRFRKKPVEIEAIRFEIGWTDEHDLLRFGGEDNPFNYGAGPGDLLSWVEIDTLEGTMKVADGDYIIKGVKGEFYPCKPDIFEATYESVA